MDHVKCKICGVRHPMREPCQNRQLTVEELGGPSVVITREVAQLYVPPEAPAKFDRNAYQREYMRKWRAKRKEKLG